LPPLNQKRAIRVLVQHGWAKGTGGKHSVKMTKAGERPITLPMHRGGDYSPSLSRAILRQAGIDPRDL